MRIENLVYCSKCNTNTWDKMNWFTKCCCMCKILWKIVHWVINEYTHKICYRLTSMNIFIYLSVVFFNRKCSLSYFWFFNSKNTIMIFEIKIVLSFFLKTKLRKMNYLLSNCRNISCKIFHCGALKVLLNCYKFHDAMFHIYWFRLNFLISRIVNKFTQLFE